MAGVGVPAGPGAMDIGGGGGAPGLEDMVEGGPGVIIAALPLDDLEGVGRANVEAGAQPVAEDLPDEDGLVLRVERQGALGAGRRAQAAPVAFIAVDLNDLSFGHRHAPGI